MVHLRIIAPPGHCEHVLELLEDTETVFNVVYLKGVARKPEGDVILCDVARRDDVPAEPAYVAPIPEEAPETDVRTPEPPTTEGDDADAIAS